MDNGSAQNMPPIWGIAIRLDFRSAENVGWRVLFGEASEGLNRSSGLLKDWESSKISSLWNFNNNKELEAVMAVDYSQARRGLWTSS